MSYQVAIIGGGVVGTAIAYELSHRIRNMVLIEKEEESMNKIVPPGDEKKPQPQKDGQDHIKSIMEKYSKFASTN